METSLSGVGASGAGASGAGDHPWLASYPPGVDWAEPIPPQPVFTLLDEQAARHPKRDCVDFLDKHYSYAEMKSLSDRIAKGLQRIGLKPGMKLGLFLPNCPYFVAFYHGALKAGATLVNFNPLYAEPEIERQIADSETDFMVTLDVVQLLPKLDAVLPKCRVKSVIVCPMADQLPFPQNLVYPFVMRSARARMQVDSRHLAFKDLIDNDGAYAPVEIDCRRDVALLQYTGGTTGVPKGAMLSHANVYTNAIQAKRYFYTVDRPESKMVGVLPLFHAFAMTCVMNWTLSVGGCMILEPKFDTQKLLRLIHRKRPTSLAGVPTLFNALLSAPNLGDFDLSSLAFCISGGAALPAEMRKAFEGRTGARLIEGYGLSEASPVCCANPVHTGGKPGSIGLPFPNTVCEVVSLDDKHQLVATGEKGEICFKGPQVMLGYWKRPEATDEVIFDGRLHTGDVGHIDQDGYVFVTDRLKEMINASGFKVYPRVIEEAIYEHAAVRECAVIGVDDPYRGQTVKAFVALKAGAAVTAEELDQFLESRLSKIEKPRLYEFRADLPKSVIGKIMKKTLVDEEKARAAQIKEIET
ncbi:MAG: long-chain fatty acid--CoA ligase [Rhodospirillaceae bacterium]|nr:long-chain fatty acid--CoA ligase [Rhodospirillaceae bacterium]